MYVLCAFINYMLYNVRLGAASHQGGCRYFARIFFFYSSDLGGSDVEDLRLRFTRCMSLLGWKLMRVL